MTKSVLLLLAALGIAPAVQAQSVARADYVVALSGDTLRGEIDGRSNSRTVFFKAPTATATEYKPQQLRAYGLRNGRSYEARALAGELPELGTTTFLEVLERGPARLYLLADGGRETFYAALATGPAVLLEKKVEKVAVNVGTTSQQTVMREQNLYRAKLAELLADCPDMGLFIAQLPFGEKHLRQAVQRYNTCRGGSTAAAPAPERRGRGMRLNLLAGGGLGQLNIATPYKDGTGGSWNATGGLGFSTYLTRRTTRTFLIGALLYDQGSYVVNGGAASFSGSATVRQFQVQVAHLRLPLGVRYCFSTKPMQFFAQGGIINSYALKLDVQYRDEYYGNPGQYTELRPYDFAQRRWEQALFLGVGLKTNHPDRRNLALQLQTDVSSGFSEGAGFGTNLRRFYALLSYDLTK